MRNLLGLVAAGALVLAGGNATAAPVQTETTATLVIDIQNVQALPITGSGTVTVDVEANTVQVPQGIVQLATPIAIPVTSVSAIKSITATALSNQAGTFSLGGATNQVPGELCPPGGPVPRATDAEVVGVACNAGGAIGGALALTGKVNVVVIAGVITIAVDLAEARIGLGGSKLTDGGFGFDGALWTAGVGQAAFRDTNTFETPGGGMFTTMFTARGTTTGVSGTMTRLSLVTPTFVNALGNNLPIFTTFTFDSVFVPEPGMVSMLVAGLGGLALLAWRRRR